MYKELRQELERILLSKELSSALNAPSHNLNFQIEEPGDRRFGLLATNVAFVYSKKLKEPEAIVISPQIIADNIVKLISPQHFEASVDGGGFVNINPTKLFVKNYLSSAPGPFNQEIIVNWNDVCMLEKIKGSQEAIHFLTELSKRRSELTTNDSLQLLSILGDPEIVSSAYLRNFGGRENTPAYLSKFEETINSLTVPSGELDLAELSPFTENLLLFLGRVDESVSRFHPERVMTHLLKLVRDFFAEYNKPCMRRKLFEAKQLPFLFHSKCSAKLVSGALKALNFSCQLPLTVL